MKYLILILILVVIGFVFWRHYSDPSTAQLLSSIEELGEDLSEEKEFEFYITFENYENAIASCNIIKNKGYQCIIEEEEGKYELIATVIFTPNENLIEEKNNFFKLLAKENNGECGGWSIGMNVEIK